VDVEKPSINTLEAYIQTIEEKKKLLEKLMEEER
jgi:hypothetical protein